MPPASRVFAAVAVVLGRRAGRARRVGGARRPPCCRRSRRAARIGGRGRAGTGAASRRRSTRTSPRRCRAMPLMLVAPASPQSSRISSTCSGESLMPGISGAIRTPVSIPASCSSATASSRFRGLGVCGSVARHAFSSSVGTERLAANRDRSFELPEQVEVAQQQRRLRQHRARVPRLQQRLPDRPA